MTKADRLDAEVDAAYQEMYRQFWLHKGEFTGSELPEDHPWVLAAFAYQDLIRRHIATVRKG